MTTQQGALHVEHVMGTVFTIAIRDAGTWHLAVADVVRWLHLVDALFSTYKHDSDISRMRLGQLSPDAADPLVSAVLDLCTQYEVETDGYFTAQLPGGLDPSGLVKGWAIQRASRLLREHGSQHHAVNGGGDVQLAGEASPGRAWRIGINDPHDRTKLLTVVTGRDIAVATSGIAERGEHIINPRTGAAASGLASVTVAGPSLERADVYATAAMAMGPAALQWLDSLPAHHAVVVHEDRRVLRTRDFHLVEGPGHQPAS